MVRGFAGLDCFKEALGSPIGHFPAPDHHVRCRITDLGGFPAQVANQMFRLVTRPKQ